jgi:heptosyltransferase-2
MGMHGDAPPTFSIHHSPFPYALPRILIIRFSAMGDLLLITPLLRAIRAKHPKASITVVTKTAFLPVLANNPRITELIGYNPRTPLRALAAELKRRSFTHRLDLHGSLRSRALRWLVGGRWSSYPKHRLVRAMLIRTKKNWYRDHRPVAERYFDAAQELEVQPDDASLEFFIDRPAMQGAETFLRGQGIGLSRTLVAVAPGAAHATKRWPLEHWRHLVASLTEQGSDVVVLGGPDEVALAEAVAEAGSPHAVSAAGRFQVSGSAAILKRARSLVSGDTGLMHLATAVGTPVLALFGPTVQAFGFQPYHARASVLELPLSCRPCSTMGSERCPLGHHRCLEDISPSMVLDALRRLPR